MKKLTKITLCTLFFVISTSSHGKTEDLGEGFHFEEVKSKQRTIASEPKVAKPNIDAVEPTDEHEEDNERGVASDIEQEPVHQGVKFWKFKP